MQIHQPYTRPSQRCYTSPTHYPGGVVLLCCSVCLTLHIGCMFVCELHSYVHESIVRLHIFWSHPLNWCDFIDVTHILVWVHSMVYDALGSFESLNVSSVSCLIYLVFSVVGLGAFVIVWLSVSLVLVTMSLSVSNCCISMSGGVVAVSSTLLWRCIHHVGWLSVWCRRSHHCLCIQRMWSGDHVSSVSDGGVHPGGVMRLVDSIM